MSRRLPPVKFLKKLHTLLKVKCEHFRAYCDFFSIQPYYKKVVLVFTSLHICEAFWREPWTDVASCGVYTKITHTVKNNWEKYRKFSKKFGISSGKVKVRVNYISKWISLELPKFTCEIKVVSNFSRTLFKSQEHTKSIKQDILAAESCIGGWVVKVLD